MLPTTPPPTAAPESPPDSTYGVILQLELSVARRADELARKYGYDQARDFWMEAEAEILSRELAFPAAS